jgi:hypothetical protein
MLDEQRMQKALLKAATEVKIMGEAVQTHIHEYFPMYEEVE